MSVCMYMCARALTYVCMHMLVRTCSPTSVLAEDSLLMVASHQLGSRMAGWWVMGLWPEEEGREQCPRMEPTM